ncbi:non-hydrolyzing UDP-N-acetylglucosamine 2-epimerase [Sphingomonas piscis]|uniref:non-hydrolyzing UDP-N-acetylglucosamine 2-epimerase n=1 Tax=Sphingomonas piscis TaxID=2714943 RepID=UPI001FE57EF3|nr:UDP-N-acetylglucosamine 2-epimerase (non-hydrolyzing) [Sphingomonas piscis]
MQLGPVAQALDARGLHPSLILTGQHPQLDLAGCGLDRFPSFSLGCEGQADPHKYVEQVFDALFPFLRRRPDLVIVQGDTSSALAGAMAAVAARVPLAHVEAGLRSHDLQQPWPEEEYRRRIDAEADLLFAPTEGAAQNLRREHVPGDIHVTGNSGVDALIAVERRLPASTLREAGQFKLLVTCHRRENWGEGLNSLADALRRVAAHADIRIDFVLHPNPEIAARIQALIGDLDNVRFSLPCTHAEQVAKMRNSDLILSDSGGMQEEAPALGVPLLVLRNTTERPEGVASGNCRLVGLHAEQIASAVLELRNDPVALARMGRRQFPFGDGTAARTIATIIDDWLSVRSGSHLLAG